MARKKKIKKLSKQLVDTLYQLKRYQIEPFVQVNFIKEKVNEYDIIPLFSGYRITTEEYYNKLVFECYNRDKQFYYLNVINKHIELKYKYKKK